MAYKRKRTYSRPGYTKRRRAISRTYRRRRPANYRRYRSRDPARTKSIKKIVNIGQGLPMAMLIKMPYRWNTPFVTGLSGGSSFNNFRLNSPYDPDLTGAGSSALYYAKFLDAQHFTKLLVYKVDIHVVFRCAATTVDDTMAFVQIRPGSMVSSVSPGEIFESGKYPYFWTGMISRFDGDRPRWEFKKTLHISTPLGISKRTLYSDDIYSAVLNANPAQGLYMACGIADDPNDTASNLKVDCEVYLRYHCKLSRSFMGT